MENKLYKMLELKDLGDEMCGGGDAISIESNRSIPFEIKRIFYIYNSVNDVVRGQHANIDSEFVLVNVSGSSKVMVTDGVNREIIALDKPMTGIYIPKMIWKEMYDFSPDSVLLVLASTHYNGEEYIRDFEKYLELMAQTNQTI